MTGAAFFSLSHGSRIGLVFEGICTLVLGDLGVNFFCFLFSSLPRFPFLRCQGIYNLDEITLLTKTS